MTTALADEIVQNHIPDLADNVEDHELRGGTHYYFLDDGGYIKISRRGVMTVNGDGKRHVLAIFAKEPAGIH
jgi:hypothetical protein